MFLPTFVHLLGNRTDRDYLRQIYLECREWNATPANFRLRQTTPLLSLSHCHVTGVTLEKQADQLADDKSRVSMMLDGCVLTGDLPSDTSNLVLGVRWCSTVSSIGEAKWNIAS